MTQGISKTLAIAAMIVLALALRIAVAPYSTGSDIPQFAGFADTFLRHKFCFYSFTEGSNAASEGWPYNWPYIYGPVWIYILASLRLVAPLPVKHFYLRNHYYVYAPISWVVAVKSVIIISDLCMGFLIFYVISKWKGFKAGVLASAAYLFNPATIYVAGIYGMFDSLAALALITSLKLYELRDSVSGILTGLAILTKQIVAPSILPLLTDSILNLRKRWKYLFYGFISTIVLYLPFALCPKSILNALKMLFGVNLTVTYTLPVSYSFNGISSLATYLHYHVGGDYLWIMESWFLPYIILQAMTLIYYLKSKDIFVSAYLSYASFIATYWRINYQYLITLIALALIALPRLKKLSLKALVLTSSVIYPAIWPMAFPTSWWFHVHIEHPNQFLIHLIDSVTLMIFDDRFYVIYSVILTVLLYATVIKTSTTSLRRRSAHAKVIQ